MTCRSNVYKVFDGETLIYKGTVQSVARKFYCSVQSIYNCSSSGDLLFDKYKIVHGEEKKKKTNEDEDLEYLHLHLKKYGNTIYNKDPTKYIRNLAELGLKIKITPYKNEKSTHYLIEVSDEKN